MEGKKTNTKTLRQSIFPSPLPRLSPSSWLLSLSLLSPQVMCDWSLEQGRGHWAHGQRGAAHPCCSLLVMLLHSGVGPTQLQGISLSQTINRYRIQYSKHPGLATVPAAGSGLLGVVALGPVLSATWSSSLRRRHEDVQCLGSLHWPLSQCPGVSVKVLSTFQHKAINNKPF